LQHFMSTHVLKIKPEHNHVRLDIFLSQTLAEVPSRTFVKKLIDAGHVKVNRKIVKANHKVTEGDEVSAEIPDGLLAPENIEPENIPLDIFYEDKYLLIVNKPIGMIVHPAQGRYTGTLVNALLHHCDQLSDLNTTQRPGIVHRLDKETSGLLVVAKDNKTHAFLAKQFKKSKVKKRYVAIVQGKLEFDEGVVEVPLGRDPNHREKRSVQFGDSAKEAITFYKVLQRVSNRRTLVALFPKTGRMHQLRVHMAYLKHPILGDQKYGQKDAFPRLALHAQSIGFTHPKKKYYVEFSSMIPQEFLAL